MTAHAGLRIISQALATLVIYIILFGLPLI